MLATVGATGLPRFCWSFSSRRAADDVLLHDSSSDQLPSFKQKDGDLGDTTLPLRFRPRVFGRMAIAVRPLRAFPFRHHHPIAGCDALEHLERPAAQQELAAVFRGGLVRGCRILLVSIRISHVDDRDKISRHRNPQVSMTGSSGYESKRRAPSRI